MTKPKRSEGNGKEPVVQNGLLVEMGTTDEEKDLRDLVTEEKDERTAIKDGNQ